MTEFEWHGRADFAEVAEALGVQSDEVMAVGSDGTALWTTETFTLGDDATIWRAALGRDADGILVVGPRVKLGTLRAWKEQMRRLLERMEGEGR